LAWAVVVGGRVCGGGWRGGVLRAGRRGGGGGAQVAHNKPTPSFLIMYFNGERAVTKTS